MQFYHLKIVVPPMTNFLHSLQSYVFIIMFVPLTYVINMSLMEGIFPSELKLAKVVRIFKSGESDKVPNYRPISVLSFFTKIFEKIMCNTVVNFMDKNDTFYQYQFGFRKIHSLSMLL